MPPESGFMFGLIAPIVNLTRMTPDPILRLDGVTLQFAHTAVPAVNHITLELHQGEILGLLGPSGCGKTTLLRLIAGFAQPQSGTIVLAGQAVADRRHCLPPERRDIGMVFQDYALFPHLTVADNVAFGLRHPRRRLAAAQIRQRTQAAIAQVGLGDLANRYPHELSGGQQQRVALARALAPQPTLVLLDEPLSNLDIQVRVRLRQEMHAILKASGTTAVFVTHDQEEALSMCDRVAVLCRGQLEQLGTPERLYYEPVSRFVAEFVTQANCLPAQWHAQGWNTEIGWFPATSPVSTATAEVMILPEGLNLVPDPTSKIVVCDRQFLGRDYRYTLRTPSGQILHARQLTRQPLPIGSAVNLSVVPTAIKIFTPS
jgi:iron(III) transport system ATP-binding protein